MAYIAENLLANIRFNGVVALLLGIRQLYPLFPLLINTVQKVLANSKTKKRNEWVATGK